MSQRRKTKCKLCGKLHEGIGKFCPTCLKAKKLIRKIPKGQRRKLGRFVRDQRVSIRRLLA